MAALEPALTVRVLRLENAQDLPLPKPFSPGSAGCDLRAAVDAPTPLAPHQRLLVPTGIVVEIPPGWEGQVRPRSGLALRHGVTVLNAPGTVDSDYRGEVGVLLINLGDETYTVKRGQRIAQLVIGPTRSVAWEETAVLETSERGAGGFGSTGGE